MLNFAGTTINSTKMGEAFGQWYAARSSPSGAAAAATATGGAGGEYRWIAAATTTPTPPDTCGYY